MIKGNIPYKEILPSVSRISSAYFQKFSPHKTTYTTILDYS